MPKSQNNLSRKAQLIETWHGLQSVAVQREISYFTSLDDEALEAMAEPELNALCKQLDRLLRLPTLR